MIADAAAVENVSARRKHFQQSTEMYKPLKNFGPNIDTVEGELLAAAQTDHHSSLQRAQ